MRLSIITINYNDAEGLRKTLASVVSQTYRNIEHVIVDGGSTDGSVEVIQNYVRQIDDRCIDNRLTSNRGKISVIWSSEPDKGIYNAINKGIQRATGNYVQILNSGDLLISDDIIERMMTILKEHGYPEMLYGNAVSVYQDRRLSSHGPGIEYSLRQLYTGTYPHDSTFFKRDLFLEDRYGLYDENLKIVSDWKWYLQAVGLGYVHPVYVDVDVTLFNLNGISSTNLELDQKERKAVLKEVLPPAILEDFEKYALPISQYRRLKKYHLWGLVHLLERILFKLEKWGVL